jgi:hypothetical protein
MGEGVMLWLRLAGVALGFPLAAWFFGWSVLGRLKGLDRAERFAASFGVSFAVLALRQFVGFVLHAPEPLFGLTTLGLMLLIAVLCLRRPGPDAPPGADLLPLAGCTALGYLHLVCIQALLPVYRGSLWYFDWWMHYDVARVFLGHQSLDAAWAEYSLPSRTPLFNLVSASVLALAGDDFWVYQAATALPNCCFIPAAYLVLRDLFGARAARLGLLLAPLNLWMLHNAWFTWPKMLAVYFLLLALHFYLRFVRTRPADPPQGSQAFLCFWVAALIAFMTHQASLVFFAPLLLHAAILALVQRAYRLGVRNLAPTALAWGLLVVPWYVWLTVTFGPSKIFTSSPVTLGDQSATFRPWEIVAWVVHNLYTSVVPIHLGTALLEGKLEFESLYYAATIFYFSLLTGALTVSLTLFLGCALVWLLVRAGYRVRAWLHGEGPARTAGPCEPGWREWTAVVMFLVLGVLAAGVLHPGKMQHGIAHAAYFPAVVLLAALAWGVLSRANRWAAAAVCAGMTTEFLLMFWSHVWLLYHDPGVLESLPGNQSYKDDAGVVFLSDWLGGGQVVFLAGAILVQTVLVGLLFRTVLRPPRQAYPEGVAEHSPGSRSAPRESKALQ